MSITSGVDGVTIAALVFGLIMFGAAYNSFVNWLGERGEGYTALLVAGGVLVTLAVVALVDWRAAALTLVAFAASGAPMIIGDIARNVVRRERAIRMQRLIAAAQAGKVIDGDES